MGKVRVFLCLSVIAMFLFMATGVATAGPVKTNLYGLDGLFLATGGSTIPAGELVLGASMLIISYDVVDGTTLPVTVTYGVSNDIEVAGAFEVNKSFDGPGGDDSGTGDLFLSGKIAFLEANSDYPATALGLRLKLPMADDPLSTEETDVAIFVASEIDMKGVIGILNVEYLIAGGDFENQVNYVVALQIPFSDTTDFSLELMDNELTGDLFAGGATFDLGSAVNFGVAVGFGLNDNAADFAAMGKFDFTF